MKKIFAAFLCVVMLFCFCGCGKREVQSFSVVNCVTVSFLSDAEREKLREPLEKLIIEALKLEPVTDSFYDSVKLFPADSKTVIPGIQYGLFDLNFDGTPELIVEPFGYSGSSGRATYSAYDIKSGKNVNVISSGNGDICVYIDVKTNSPVILSEYRSRCGWAENGYYLDLMEFDENTNRYVSRCILESYYSYESTLEERGGEEVWSGIFYAHGERTGWEHYAAVMDSIRTDYVRIPELQLKLVLDDHFYDLDISIEEHAKMIVDAILSAEQEFYKNIK